MKAVAVLPGVRLWPGRLGRDEQTDLFADIMARVAFSPWFTPAMPRTGKPFSVAMTNFGPLGWVSDSKGYRYQPRHPVTDKPWPGIPEVLLTLWNETTHYRAPPEACLVNLYRGSARMGLHRDEDEAARDAPVLSVSLGDSAMFRLGGLTRGAVSHALKLASGDVLMFGGPSRLIYHGIARIEAGSGLIPGGGRINLTLRRVTKPQK